jgi:FAD:protein FMN transferase
LPFCREATGAVGMAAAGLVIAVVLCGMASRAGVPAGEPALYRQARRVMGTFCEIQVYHTDAGAAEQAIKRALDEMERVDRLLSNYDPKSELSAMNKEASVSPFRASPELFGFVKRCREFYAATAGAFDPTVGPLVRAWGFLTQHPAKPTDSEIEAAKAKSGFDKVRLDNHSRTVSYWVAGVEIDPGGIGKGYAVDRAVMVLKQLGIRSALVSAGGSTLYALGHPPNRPGWRIAIKDPEDEQKSVAIIELKNNSLSTSGVSEKSVQIGPRRYGHIFDPRTGESAEGMCQVTVVAPNATESDALTKAAFILAREDAWAFLRPRAGVHALRMEGACGTGGAVQITPWSSTVFIRNP